MPPAIQADPCFTIKPWVPLRWGFKQHFYHVLRHCFFLAHRTILNSRVKHLKDSNSKCFNGVTLLYTCTKTSWEWLLPLPGDIYILQTFLSASGAATVVGERIVKPYYLINWLPLTVIRRKVWIENKICVHLQIICLLWFFRLNKKYLSEYVVII